MGLKMRFVLYKAENIVGGADNEMVSSIFSFLTMFSKGYFLRVKSRGIL